MFCIYGPTPLPVKMMTLMRKMWTKLMFALPTSTSYNGQDGDLGEHLDDVLFDVLDDDYEDEAYVCAPHWASIAEILSHPPELSGPDWQRG